MQDIKIVLVGASGVGKSAIIRRFGDNEYSDKGESTLGVDMKIRTLQVNGNTIKCHVWDTAGQERFHVLTKQFLRNADVILLCFDPGLPETLGHLVDSYMDQCLNENAYCALVATKTDENPCERRNQDMLRKLEAMEMSLFWTSSKTGENIDDVFKSVCIHCIETTPKQRVSSVKLTAPPIKSSNMCCF